MSRIEAPIRLDRRKEGALWCVNLASPKANILDQKTIEALTGVFVEAQGDAALKAVILGSDGPHFSFGASVEEHLPGRFEGMIPAFHRLFHAMLESEVVCLAAIRGRCLGGGLELVSLCTRLFAAPGAALGQPEIVLGVFPPIASVLLTERIGRGRAEDVCLSGRTLDAEEAHRIGLIDELVEDPDAAALAYAERHFLPRSARSLRLAVRAVRTGLRRRFAEELAEVENLYVADLMATHDAVEGLEAFLAKRPAQWRNR